MPLYRFTLGDGSPCGAAMLPDLAAARAEAVRLAGAVRADAAFWHGAGWSVAASDADGMILFQLHLFAISAPCTREPDGPILAGPGARSG